MYREFSFSVFQEDEKPATVETEVKNAIQALGRHKSTGTDEISIDQVEDTEMKFTKIF